VKAGREDMLKQEASNGEATNRGACRSRYTESREGESKGQRAAGLSSILELMSREDTSTNTP